MMILDDFFWRAVIAGMGVAIVAGPLGCFVVWRRMSYLGDTMAHSALLGVALGFFLEVNLMLGVFAVALVVALLLFFFQRQKQLANDAVLGTLSHASLAMG
ncbi:MAG TPA: metal ABC transporter permease, partial [Arenicellales bacterium]|nr:metal ABC transporter permease [Arenicellales bacterium]